MIEIGLLGAGHQAVETAEAATPGASVAFAAVDAAFLDRASAFRLVDLETRDGRLLSIPVTVSVGPPLLRRRLVETWGGTEFHSVIAPSAVVSVSAHLGAGVTVSPGAVLSAGVTMRDHSHVNIGALLSHGVRLGRFSVVAPGARLTGEVDVGDGVFVGAGATVISGARLADGCVIGAGAVVIADTEPLGVYVGVPARLVSRREEWLGAV